VCERRKLGAVVVCIERAGELSRTVASNFKIGVLNASQELLFPLLNDGTQAVLIDAYEVITA